MDQCTFRWHGALVALLVIAGAAWPAAAHDVALDLDLLARYRAPADAFIVADALRLDRAVASADEHAEPPRIEIPFSPTFFRIGIADAGRVLTLPARWDGDDWRRAGWITAGIAVTAIALDEPLRDALGSGDTRGDGALAQVERFGTPSRSNPMLAAFYLAGAITDDDTARAVAIDGLIAGSLANRLVTRPLKHVFGRDRPHESDDAHDFDAFGDGRSFPSGHATHAFAMASVIASHYDAAWVDWTAYGLASVVGYARIRHEQHWTSDVLAGAAIGTLVGREVVSFNRAWRAGRAVSRPMLGAGDGLVTVTWWF